MVSRKTRPVIVSMSGGSTDDCPRHLNRALRLLLNADAHVARRLRVSDPLETQQAAQSVHGRGHAGRNDRA